MRKKTSNILMGILLIFAGLFVSACGDKYKDFEFKISYAFSESTETWYDATEGISLNYDVDDKGTLSYASDDEYVFSINGNEERVKKNDFNICLKAEVKNVKSKHLDSITISAQGASGLAFSSSTIKSGHVVKLPVVGLVNSQLSLYENKSGRSTKINLSVYGKIKDITRNDTITPAIVVNGTLDLNSIRDLVLYNKDGITTNQTGVTYEVVDFGYFTSAGSYQADSLTNNQLNRQFLSLTNGKLKLNKIIRTVSGEKEFTVTENNNVIRIKATSNYNSEITTDIYVYVVGGDLISPVVTFDGTDINVNSSTLINKGLDLYFNSADEDPLDKYTNSTVQVGGIDGVYKNGITTADGRTLKYKVKAYIGNSYNPYEFGSDVPARNLKISENDNKYNIALASQSSESKVNVKFAYELVCEKDEITYPVTFTNSKPVLETVVEVRKHILASSIIVNGEEYRNETINGVVYSTSIEKYTGFKAELGIEPLDSNIPQKIEISGIEKLSILNRKGFKVNSGDKLSNGEVVNIKFASGVYNNQTAVFKVLKTPTYFNGQDVADAQYITVNLELTRKVTADALEFVDGNDLTKDVSTINISTNANSSIFVKAFHSGNLDRETIALTSNNCVLNTNGDKTIYLNADNVTTNIDWNGDGYTIFKIDIPATNGVLASKLEVFAGEYGNGANSIATLNAVNLINNSENIKILAKNNDNVTSFDNNKFAVVKGKEVSFNVVEEIGGTNIENTIHKVTLSNVEINDDKIKDKFGGAEVLTKTEFGDNTFSIYGWNAKTRVFDVNVQYYAQNPNGVVSLHTKTINNVQFAVYNPITSISIGITRDKIAYVNSLFPEAATTEISYASYSGVGAEVPTGTVYFINYDGKLDETTGANATSVNVSISRDLSGNDFKDKVKLFREAGATYVELINTGTSLCNKVSSTGAVKLQLINSIAGLNNVKFIVTANRFNNETTVVNDVNVSIASVDRATGIDVTRGEIVEYSNENRELQLSFMGIADGTIYKEFAVKPVYTNAIPDANSLQFKDLVWQLYKYDYVDGNWQFNENKQITNFTNSLNIVENNGEFIITADKNITGIGGLYKLVISTKDSYQSTTGIYNVQWSLDIRVSDGKIMPYIITTHDQFINIDTDLSANYTLGNNITIPKLERPIGLAGNSVAAFTGSLSGRFVTSASKFNFNLNITIDKYIGTTGEYKNVYGLFSILGEEGRISNLNINITFDGIETGDISTIGGIVAVNKGIIENVNATIFGENILIKHATNIGGIVGINETSGNIINCVVNSAQGLRINAEAASNIGGIVGENYGTIIGKYNGKEDLNNIKYDNIVNITINNNADNIAYNIGAVAGVSSADITNMLVGGKIEVVSKYSNGTARPLNEDGYLAGIVGSTSADVKTVAAVGLNLINEDKNGINVAGIAGIAKNRSDIKEIKDAKFVSVLAKFGSQEFTGRMIGKTVAGISHNANVTYSTIENFIKTIENAAGVKSTFYTFEGETVYGLIKEGSVSNSFVSANINATNVYLTSNTTESTTYFIGKINEEISISTFVIKSTYAVVYNNTNFVQIFGFTFDEINYNNHIKTTEPISLNESWLTEVSKLEDFEVDGKYNIVNISKYQGIDFYFPYIVKDGSPLMILQPDSIKAEINQDYQIDVEENIYVGDVNIKDDETNPTYEIKESIVVDFFENKYDNYGNLDVNKHKLVNDGTDDGLIDLTMLPANVTAGLTFELVANYGDIARIKDNTYLILTGASNLQPIILRAYSMFNPEAEAYFAIYSQRTFSELILEGNNVTKLDEQDYVVNVYQGRNSTIALKADNIKEGTSYDSILTNNSHMVKVDAVIDETNLKFNYEKEPGVFESLDKFSFNTNNLSSIIISINEKYNAQPDDEFNVILNVSLIEDYFKGLKSDLLLDTINLKVNLNNVATKLDIVGANDFEIDSSSTLNFEASLKTGFVNTAIADQECDVDVDDNGIVIVDKNNVEKKDSIRMNIYSTSSELIRIKTETGAKSFAELFNIDVYETKTDDDDGYNYEVNLSLKDEFNYRYVTSNIDLVVNIWAASNPNVMNAVNVTIKPTTANTIRLDSYAVEGVNVVSNTKSELTLGQVESSIISPGGRGNMLLAYVEKSYSNIDSITITSSDLFVPEFGRNVNLVFTQYVYNKTTRKFETLFNSNVQAQNGKTLELQKVTTIENGKTEYTGILYIHAQLIKVSGLEARISATLNVVSNGISIPAETIDMLTTFLPGANLSYNGIAADNGGYLVQESTYGNTARIKLYGYQFNSNPTMIVDWELVDGVDYFYQIGGNNKKVSSDDDKQTAYEEGKLYYYLANDITEEIDGKTVTIQTKGYYKAVSESDLDKSDTFYSISNKKVIEKGGKTYNIADYVSTYFLKQYDKVDYNPVDGSYSMEVLFNIAKDIPANFSMQASMSLITSDGQFERSDSEKLVFYPTKYVVTDIALKDTAGNRKMLAINRTDKLDFLFSTLRGDYDYSRAIYDEIFLSDIADLKALFSYYDPTEKTFNNENTAFNVEFRNNFLSITGLSTFEKEVTLKVYVGYVFENGKYKLVFGEQGASNVRLLTYSFTLQIYPGATEENANPIYSAYDMFDESGNSRLAANGHYILMNDITLDLVKPIENIASLDGNNHIIKIKNFVIDPSKTEYGLFANIGTYQDEEGKTHKSILKNVVVDYSEFDVENSGNIEFINNQMTTIKFGGLVATNNGGLIYNCDVVNSNASIDKVINILVDENASLTFGGLVATNSGIITNSRVGRREFKDVDAVNDTYVNTTFGGLEFVLGNETKSGFDAISGGFVGENSGTISSSYFANSSLVNYANSNETNITAGFAGKNNSGASIVYSYVKAKETTITSTQPYAKGNRIENKSNGIVAGFVYENAGTITDSYANTELYTDSTYMSGFVYTNLSGGQISESYAACTMKKEFGEEQNNAQQPFVGRDNKDKYLNAGTMENNYYLLNSDGSGDIEQTFAQALNATNFKNANNLQGFVFIQSNVEEERQQGVWSHIDTKGNSLILPELMNANVVATSAKYLLSDDKDENGITKYTYTNASSVTEGTRYNPYIIRNVQEFNATLTGNRVDMSDPTSKSGYIRLIDSINFGEDHEAIKTRINYTLGNEYRSNLTSFEGNGLNIEGIYFDNPQTQTNSMGLFSKIENAYVKNVNLSFVKPKNGVQYGTTNVKFSGGLAGIISNSAIINVILDGKDVSLTGQNYVGGLVGLVNGDSLLYGISSNLSASADSSETALYYSEKDYRDLGNTDDYNQYISKLSYAGGIAGVIDVVKRAGTDYNVSYIDVYGDQMFVKTTEQQLPNIEGQYAGGIAGFAGSNVSALKLKYHTGTSDWISGNVAAGGLFAVSLGKIMASQVTAVEDTQFEYDTEFGKYVLDIEKGLDRTKVGNLNLIESNGYAGGLIGIGLNAGIDASYAKAGFRNGKVIGGLIGLSVASNVTYSYAVPFVNINDTTKDTIKEVGGLIGSAHVVEKGINYNSDPLSKYKELVKVYLNRDIASSSIAYTDVQFTFSTLLVEGSQLEKYEIDNEKTSDNDIKLGYLVPNSRDSANVNAIRSGGNTTYSGVFEGRLADYSYTFYDKEDDKEKNVDPIFTTEKSKESKLEIVYDLTHTSQESTFIEMFESWKKISYWSVNHLKYFPLLINERIDNYVLLYEASDFRFLESNPDGKFKVVQDIDLSKDFETDGNWVIGVEFRGELIGEIDSETQERKKIKNITLNPNQANESSGFFKATKGAKISDLEFVWNDGGQSDDGAINSSVNLTNVSGLSCLDSYDENGEFSKFDNIEVSVSGDGYLIKPGTNKITINSFGGVVASTQNSLITECDFVGKVDVILKNHPTTNETTAYFGGLVGKAEKSLGDGSEKYENSSMTIMRSNVGANGEDTSKTTTEFNIQVNGAAQAYIGGAIGHITDTSVSSVSVGGVNYEDGYQTIKMDVKLTDNSENYAQHNAGLIGYSNNSAINGNNASVEIIVSDDITKENGYKTTIAGLIGTYQIQSDKVNEKEEDEDGNSSTTKKVNVEITNSNSKATIDVSQLKTSTLLIAGGVGSLTSSDTLGIMKQCLFTGSIVGEKEDKEDAGIIYQTQASYIYAGGAIAQTVGSAKINETMTTIDITIGATNDQFATLLAGGFVGNVSDAGATLTLNNVVSSGKIVPFCGNRATKVHLGGMIGSVDDNVTSATITNSYTVTSIIADAIAGKALQHTSSDALVGFAEEGKVTAENVYFSTDFALTTNDKNLGTNIAGSDFVLSKNSVWKTKFTSDNQANMWKFIPEGSLYGYLPYIKALEDSLKIYKVLVNGNYVEGTSLRPIVISEDRNFESDKNLNNDFNYYILTDVVNLTNELHGVLICKDVELTTDTANLISAIGKHSAVSNIHLNIQDNSPISLAVTDDGNGFIAQTNNGLIFNCSVKGKGITINTYIGVIAGVNNGTISYSYSTIEILSVSTASGIAYTNSGVINSCYFTGYINGGTNTAGIMSDATGDDVYVYNNYMAGVITNISRDETSFFAGNIENFDGKNNHIDQFANNELGISVSYTEGPSGSETTNQVLQSVTTAELMSRIGADYAGSWYTTVNASGEIITATVKDDKTIDGTFGYNYGYPIYKFNKLGTNVVASGLKYSDIEYSLKTGTGEDSSTDLSTRYTNLKGDLYNNAYKIPHLGVMTAVHGLQGVLTDHGLQEVSRNYVIIYDITGKASRKNNGEMIEWNGVCSTSEINEGFVKTGAFNGVIVTNKNLANNFDGSDKSKYVCKIEGLNYSGLFNEIGKSYIADITLGSFGEIVPKVEEKPAINGLTNSGAIGKSVVDETNINHISFVDDSVIVGNNFGGLFGSVQSSVTIQNFNSSNGSSAAVTLQGVGTESTAGLIANELKGGTINLDNDATSIPTNHLYPFFKGVGTAGGLVGTAVSGTIKGNTNKVRLANNLGDTTNAIGSYGGIVGKEEGEIIVNDVNIEFENDAAITANSFGGFVSEVAGTVTFEGCTINGSELIINSQTSAESQKGLLIGKISSGSATITGFMLHSPITLNCNGSEGGEDSKSSIGGFVGTQNGDFNLEISGIQTITINAQNTQNLGGIIGVYTSGNINVAGSLSTTTLNGYKNVGGFIGKAEAWPKRAEKLLIPVEEGSPIERGTINFLNTSAYAKIQITKFAEANFGGLFGLLKAIQPEDSVVTNYNTFTIAAEGGSKTVINIGGVAGLVDNAEASFENLTNSVSIDGTGRTKYTFKNVGGIFGNFNGKSITTATNSGSVKFANIVENNDAISNASVNGSQVTTYAIAINVGGIIGLADNTTENAFEFTNLTNSVEISGYQNVGGLIGYANKIKLTTGESDGIVAGVINVGGAFGCVQESELQSISSTTKVYGNTNVGGLIGLSNNNTLIGNIVGGDTAPDYTKSDDVLNNDLTTIKAIYYNVYNTSGTNKDYVSYIPTGVGGLIGASQETTIESNTVQNVRIISTDEGKETESNNSESKGMISTISNYMANAGAGEGSALTDNYLKSDITPLTNGTSNKQEFAKLTSGFGGFIGTLDNTDNISSDSKISNLTIKAPLGINVGTYYGFYNHIGDFNAPTLTGTIYVDGAYNVGGIAGKTTGEITSLSNASLQGNAEINLQSEISGMYVGGLLGELNSDNVSEIKIVDAKSSNVDIVIHTNSSYYIGGLVGKLSVNGKNTFNGDATNVQVATNNDDAQNFGGLVGMFKITGTADNVTYSVNGTHNFPFTVNTIENQNYAEGSSQFETTEMADSIELAAQAYYINQDSFNISATKDDFYVFGNNPLRRDSKGWAKEYTGFKQVQRCIPARQNNGADWDSIAIVYNAENISHVKTIVNATSDELEGLAKETVDGSEKYFYINDGNEKVYLDPNYIIYTIYDKAVNKPMLYCASGVAELLTEDDGTPVTNVYDYHRKKSIDDPRYVGGKYKVKLEWPWNGWVSVKFESALTESTKGNVLYDMQLQDMVWFDWTDTNKTMLINLDMTDLNKGYENKFSTELCHYKVDGQYFFFKTIYANRTILGDLGTNYQGDVNGDGENNDDPVEFTRYTAGNVSSSGSVFEVCGMKPGFSTINSNDADNSIWGWIVAGILAIILVLVEIFITKGAITKAVLSILSKIWKAFASMALKMKLVVVGLVLAISSIVGSLSSSHTVGKYISSEIFFNATDQNLGLLTSTVVTELRYDNNGQWKSTIADTITVTDIDGEEYTYNFYSNQKPNDYYSNYYCAMVDITAPGFSLLDNKDLTISISKEEMVNTLDYVNHNGANCKYRFKFKDETDTREVYLTYIYYEGKYYSNSLAIGIGHYETNELSNLDFAEREEYEVYFDASGVGHVSGIYDNGNYYFDVPNDDEPDGNLVEKYLNNVQVQDETEKTVKDETATFKLNGVTLAQPYVENETNFYFYGKSGGGNDGYQFAKGAYYTTIGARNSQIGEDEYAVKYANFKYSATLPAGVQGIDYVAMNHSYYEQNDEGEFKSEDEIVFESLTSDDYENGICKIEGTKRYSKIDQSPVYFKLDTTKTGITSENKEVLNLNRALKEGDSIDLALYPYSLYNPYDQSNQSFAASNLTDTYTYTYKSERENSFKINNRVRYYYYDGGYKLGQDLLSNVSEEEHADSVYKYAVYKDVTDLYKMKDGSYIDGEYDVYKLDGTKVTLSYKDMFTNFETQGSQYYIVDCSGLEGEDETKETLQLKYAFILKGGKIYERDSLYVLDESTGKVNKLYPIVYKSSNVKDYIANRYLTNKEHSLYTIFKHKVGNTTQDFNYAQDDSIWKVNNYDSDGNSLDPIYFYAIPTRENQRIPNYKTTNLIESCKITLGGDYNLRYTGSGGTVNSGSITVS